MKFSYFDTIFFYSIFPTSRTFSSNLFFKMAANMADMQKTVAGKKLNSRILTQFFSYNICPTPRTSSWTFFFKMAANMAAMQKTVDDKKLNSHIFTQFFTYNICPTSQTSSSIFFSKTATSTAAIQKICAVKNVLVFWYYLFATEMISLAWHTWECLQGLLL